MKIILNSEESEKYFYNALCNGLDYMCSGYDLTFKYSDSDYKKSAENLRATSTGTICFEDVLMDILRLGGKLKIIDLNSDEVWKISLAEVHERVSLTPVHHLMAMINENDDAVTADAILQTVFIGEVVFG